MGRKNTNGAEVVGIDSACGHLMRPFNSWPATLIAGSSSPKRPVFRVGYWRIDEELPRSCVWVCGYVCVAHATYTYKRIYHDAESTYHMCQVQI